MTRPQPDQNPKSPSRKSRQRKIGRVRQFIPRLLARPIQMVKDLFWVIVTLLALPLILFLLLTALLGEVARELREKCRRYCPLHGVRFASEVVVIQAKGSQNPPSSPSASSSPNDVMILRASERLLTWEERYVRERSKEFPYAHTRLYPLLKAGPHRNRYCPVCRAVQEHYAEEALKARAEAERRELAAMLSNLSVRERREMEARALRELEELERKLGLVPSLPIRDADESTEIKDGYSHG